MIPELVSFVILLVVFILAYGLASQALINPAQVDFCLFVAFVDFFVGFFVGFFVDFFVGFFNLIGGVLRTGQSSPINHPLPVATFINTTREKIIE